MDRHICGRQNSSIGRFYPDTKGFTTGGSNAMLDSIDGENEIVLVAHRIDPSKAAGASDVSLLAKYVRPDFTQYVAVHA